MESRAHICFSLNGVVQEVTGDDAFLMLADYLRQQKQLTGTKIVCAEGDCGACTVLRAFPRPGRREPLRFEAINACIVLVGQLDGMHVVTVDALAENGVLTPIQDAMVSCHASQCGYCTPGFVMTLSAGLEGRSSCPSRQELKNMLTGNLCRCTGYSPILEAAESLDYAARQPLIDRFVPSSLQKSLQKKLKASVSITAKAGRFWAPKDLREALRLRKKYPEATLLSAGTDLGVQLNKGIRPRGDIISLHHIPEFYRQVRKGSNLSFGARVSLDEVRRTCAETVPEFSRMLHIFASPQIKSTASLVGNIANASPIGDTLPFLLATEAKVSMINARRAREVPLDELYQGYRRLAIKADELIDKVSFRIPSQAEVLRIYKASARKDMDISAVSAAFVCTPRRIGERLTLQQVRLAFGGLAATPLRLKRLEEFLEGKVLDKELVKEAKQKLQDEIQPLSDVRGSAAYRRLLAENFLQLYCDELLRQGASHG